MFKFLKENIITTNDCLILATPMILFFISIQWYTETFQKDLIGLNTHIAFFFNLWIWIAGCFAGWFYMLKKTLQFSKKTFLFDTDRNTALKKLFLCIFKGIGKFFFPFLGFAAIIFAFNLIKAIFNFYLYNSAFKPHYDIILIISYLVTLIAAYWVIYWIPEIVYTYKNPFKSLINSVKKAYISFRQTSKYYILIAIVISILDFTIEAMKIYPVIYFLELLLFYYFILYSVIIIFRLYEKNFIE